MSPPDSSTEATGQGMERSLVIIPTYNERDNIGPLLEALFSLDSVGPYVLVVDDHSPDGTGEVVERLMGRFPRLEAIHRPCRLGLGGAYIEGFQFAIRNRFDFVFSMDSDFSHEPKYIPEFLDAARGLDVVVGSRYLQGVSVVNWSLRRLFLSVSANTYARLITGLPLRDCTSGFQCFRLAVLDAINFDRIRTNGYSFLIELKYRAFKKGFRIGEIPIIFLERRGGISKITRMEIFRSMWTVWKLRLGMYRE